MQRIAISKISVLVLLVLLGVVAGMHCSKDLVTDSPEKQQNDQGIILAEVTSSPSVIGLGGAESRITAVLVDDQNNPVSNQLVHFHTTLGEISPAADSTDYSGKAYAILRSGAIAGVAQVTASYGQLEKTTTVLFDSSLTRDIVVTSTKEAILSNGIDSTQITAMVYDDNGKPAEGQVIVFRTTAGYFARRDIRTDQTGRARAVLVGFASSTDSLALVTVESQSLFKTVEISLKGVNLSLDANPTSLIANGTSTATVCALLKESSTNIAISGASVIFATDLGTIPNQATTDASGVASVELKSSRQVGLATVVARYGNTLLDTVQVEFIRSEPTYLTVTAEPTVLVADNQSQSKITAVVSDLNNNPVPDGTQVHFQIIHGSGSIETVKLTQNGIAISKLTSGVELDTAWVEVAVGSLRDTVTVRYVVGNAATITVKCDSVTLPADGITTTNVYATVRDKSGNPVADGTTVHFSSSIGNITTENTTTNGVAQAQFSSSITGVATIQASVGSIVGETTILLRPGKPNSINLSFSPRAVWVKDTGRNQTLTIKAEVVDSKNNPVIDGTYVKFSIYASPGGGECLSADDPVPTVNGIAQISFRSGTRSGPVRIQAEITDESGNPLTPPVRAISTEILIFAGPPYIEDITDVSTSHLAVGSAKKNIRGWDWVNNTTTVTVVVGDKYNNPVAEGTAVYFTMTAGLITTYTGYTDANGVASVTIHTGNPVPTIDRYYNTFYEPNFGTVIPGPIPDFEGGLVLNSQGNYGENDGVARVLAVTEGVDANGNPAKVWGVTNVVFSGAITTFKVIQPPVDTLYTGESTQIIFDIYDINGNPIVAGSTISASVSNGGALSWTSIETEDPGVTRYYLTLANNLDPGSGDTKIKKTTVFIKVDSENGNPSLEVSPSVVLIPAERE